MAKKTTKTIEEQYRERFETLFFNPDECSVVKFTPPDGNTHRLHFRIMGAKIHYVFFDGARGETAYIGLAPDQSPEQFVEQLNQLYK